MFFVMMPVKALVKLPDLTVCEGASKTHLKTTVCSKGFLIEFLSRQINEKVGTVSYHYKICDKHGLTESCPYENFSGISHVDLLLPKSGSVFSCLSSKTQVTGECSQGIFELGDSACFGKESGSQSFVAKCKNILLSNGGCFTMVVHFSGESTQMGFIPVILVDKDLQSCEASCLPGPVCESGSISQLSGLSSSACISRPADFWAMHPWITNKYANISAPLMVCGVQMGCNGLDDGKSNPSCGTGYATDIMSALLSENNLVKQLAAAKLNLVATHELLNKANCADYKTAQSKEAISDLIKRCEGLCQADQSAILASGCTKALEAFNQSQDTGFAQTPAPFDRPLTDDHGG